MSKETECLQKKLEKLKQKHEKNHDQIHCICERVIDEIEEAVRDIASSIQRDIDKRKENTKVKYSDFPIPSFGFRSYWKGYIEAKEEDKKLLVGSSPTEDSGC